MATGWDGTVALVLAGGVQPDGISPLQLVRGEIDENDTDTAAPKAPADIRLERPPIQHTRIDPVAIGRALESVLATNELPPPSSTWLRIGLQGDVPGEPGVLRPKPFEHKLVLGEFPNGLCVVWQERRWRTDERVCSDEQ